MAASTSTVTAVPAVAPSSNNLCNGQLTAAKSVSRSEVPARSFSTMMGYSICGAMEISTPITAEPAAAPFQPRSEEHTSELQSRGHLVCRLLLEKKNQYINTRSLTN